MLVRTLERWILTVAVLCEHFRHTRDDCLLHTPLIDVPWLFPSSSQDECSVLTRRALLLSVGVQTSLMISSLHVSCTWLRSLLHSDPWDKLSGSCSSSCRRRVCICVGCCSLSVSACTHLRPPRFDVWSKHRRSWVNSIIFCCRASRDVAESHDLSTLLSGRLSCWQAPFPLLDLVQLLLALLELKGRELDIEPSCTFWHHSVRFTYHPCRHRNLLKNHGNMSLEN